MRIHRSRYHSQVCQHQGKDRTVTGENEIDLIIEEDGILYPVEIKMTGNPKATMGATNQILDKIPEKREDLAQ